MRLRPYKSCDAKKIISWIKDEEVFLKWGGDHFGSYPILCIFWHLAWTPGLGDSPLCVELVLTLLGEFAHISWLRG